LFWLPNYSGTERTTSLSPSRAPTEEELALAESMFGMFQLFRSVGQRAAQAVDLGSGERARLLWGLKAGACRAGQLAQQAKISPSTITEIVEGLERDGFVRRETDPSDRRAVRVALTAEGRRHLQRFEHAAAVALGESLASLTAAQRARIRAAFNDLRQAIPASDANQKETAGAR
jgi:DNA-binding MarR family transcriptional regulator